MHPDLPHIERAAILRWLRWLIGEPRHREPWWAEVWAATAAVAWSCWGWWFTAGIQYSPAFQMLVDFMGQQVWYATGILFGLTQLLSLRHDLPGLRWWMAALMSWWWLFIALAVAQGSSEPRPGVVLYLVFAAVNLYSMARLRYLDE